MELDAGTGDARTLGTRVEIGATGALTGRERVR
jgi:hypothetical protein